METFLEKNYGLNVSALTQLEGYDSLNYKVSCNHDTYVLKQYPNNKETAALLKSEEHILKLLVDLDRYDFPQVIPSLDNQYHIIKDDSIFCLLTYVEGSFLGDVEHTSSLLRSFGTFLGKLDKTIHNAKETPILAKEIQWDLKHFKNNYHYLEYITDPKDRNLVDYFFLQFDEQVYPIQQQLRKGTIHNDGNDWNVLTQEGRISGIIDFGDMCHSWLINEVAVAITYVMMEKENPLDIASEVIIGYHNVFPLQELELDVLYYLVAARLCTSVCNSAYTKLQKPDSEYITISERPAWNLLRKWLTINPIQAKDTFRKASGFPPIIEVDIEKQLQRRKKYLSSALSLSYERPIAMSRSAFQYMYDTDGNTILDAYNNIMLAGHCHPRVVRAGQKTMARLNTNTRYVYDEILHYSEKLLSKFPAKLNKIFFVNSGSAASDLAIRIAMTHTHMQKVMVLDHGYHGNTSIGIDISPYKYNHEGGMGQQNYILQTPMPNAFGSGFNDDGTAGDHFANLTTNQLKSDLGQIAAFIAEPIVGCGGQVPLAKNYLKRVYQEIRKQGGICISDEVQVGFGRLGNHFWGFEMHEVVPDMVILGKPMANGQPIGAVVTTTEIAESFDNGLEFFSSFGGNPVSCAIGNAVLEVIEEEGLQQHAKETGNYLMNLLKKLQKNHPEIANVRGSGLFIGIEIFNERGEPNTELASQLKNELREKHILIGTDGPYNSVLKIKPPLSFNKTDCDILVNAIRSVLTHS